MDVSEIERATRGQVNARRNYLVGLWAGRMLGYRDRRLSGYVIEVMQSDYLEPGPADVIHKVRRDFEASGIGICEREILRQLQLAERGVRAELLATD